MIKKVDLTAYIDGERIVIGEAYVDINGSHVDVTGEITNPEHLKHLHSLAVGPFPVYSLHNQSEEQK